MENLRVKKVLISEEVISGIFTTGYIPGHCVCNKGLPEGSELVGFAYHTWEPFVTVYFKHESFEIVDKLENAPTFKPEFIKLEDG